MSGLEDAKLIPFERGQDGKKGHYRVEAEGAEAVARNSQSYSGRAHAGGGCGAYLIERAADTTDSKTYTAGRGRRDTA